MKRATLAIALILALFCLSAPAQAARPFAGTQSEAIAHLLETRICVGCDLHGADLSHKDLRGVNLTHANLRDANLSGANMMAVNLQDADLRGADLRKADILAVNLIDANLRGANVGRINLDSSRLCHTVTPAGKVSNRDC